MLVLILFAVVAGAGTALSPCVLPVLPALLSASGSGGRRRPLGIVLGLTVTFAVTIVGIAKVAGGVGLGADPLRQGAVVVLVVFGLAVAVPAVGRRLERPLAALSRLGPRTRGTASPPACRGRGARLRLHPVRRTDPGRGDLGRRVARRAEVAVGVAYAAGSAVVLLGLALGGRRLVDRLRAAGRGQGLQRGLGVVMILTAVVIAARLDVRLDQLIAQRIPDVSLTAGLEKTRAVSSRLAALHPPSRFAPASGSMPAVAAAARGAAARAPALPALGAAPEFTGTERWFNTPGGRPLTMAGLRGRVVLIDFWTYTCINCLRTLPYLEAWDRRYRAGGLTIVGVHSPEFAFEHDAGNVARRSSRWGSPTRSSRTTSMAPGTPRQPVLAGRVPGRRRGPGPQGPLRRGDYAQTEAEIRSLLTAAGSAARRDRRASGRRDHPVGAGHAGDLPGRGPGAGLAAGEPEGRNPRLRGPRGPAPARRVQLRGAWTITPEGAVAGTGRGSTPRCRARTSTSSCPPAAGGTGRVAVELDGRPGADGRRRPGGAVTVNRQRLYQLAASAPSRGTA